MTRLKYPAKILSVLLLVVSLVAGCRSFEFPGASRPSGSGVYHTVRAGQTLYRIAEVYGVDLKTLRRVNGLRDPDHIEDGQRLWIPNARRVRFVPPTGAAGKPGVRKPVRGYLIWPVDGKLTSKFGNRRGRHHDGIDIATRKGADIAAAAGGKVVFSGWGPTGYGLMIIIRHPNRLMTVYAHNSKNYVKENTVVKQGQKIASIGSTGRSTGPHLHFEVRNDTHSVDPLPYLPKK